MGGATAVQAGQGTPLPDEDVIRRVLDGDTALFEVLMRRHNQRIYRAARAIVRDESEAEDVMQQAYLQAFAHLSQFAGRAQFSTWLTRIAVHEALARVRRRAREAPFDPAEPRAEETMTSLRERTANPEQQAATSELRHLLESAIDKLPRGHRAVVMLRDVEGLSTAEVANSLGLSEENVKTRLHRARAALRRELVQQAGAEARTAFAFQAPRCDRVVAAVLSRILPEPRTAV